MFVGWCNSTGADLVDSPPVLLVIPQHAGPQHVHHLWELLIHEGGSGFRKHSQKKEGEGNIVLLLTIILICNARQSTIGLVSPFTAFDQRPPFTTEPNSGSILGSKVLLSIFLFVF